MIECPICQVVNDDQSLFCVECGQRFSIGSSGTSPGPQDSKQDLHESKSSQRPRVKLRSPILGNIDDDEYSSDTANSGDMESSSGYEQSLHTTRTGRSGAGQDSRELITDFESRSTSAPKGSTGSPGESRKKKLHSPLLGDNEDYEDDDEDVQVIDSTPFPHRTHGIKPSPPAARSQNSKTGQRPRLHSPILGGGGRSYDEDDFEDNEEESLEEIKQKSGQSNRPKPKLRSPILGGYQEEDDDDADDVVDSSPGSRKLIESKAGKSNRLHSPIFGTREEEDDDDELTDDAPYALRSPLLGAVSRRRKDRKEDRKEDLIKNDQPSIKIEKSPDKSKDALNRRSTPNQKGIGYKIEDTLIEPVAAINPSDNLYENSQSNIKAFQPQRPGQSFNPPAPPLPSSTPPPIPGESIVSPNHAPSLGLNVPLPGQMPFEESASDAKPDILIDLSPPRDSSAPLNIVPHLEDVPDPALLTDSNSFSLEKEPEHALPAFPDKRSQSSRSLEFTGPTDITGPSDRRQKSEDRRRSDRRVSTLLDDKYDYKSLGRREPATFDEDSDSFSSETFSNNGLSMAAKTVLISCALLALVTKIYFFVENGANLQQAPLPISFYLDQLICAAALIACLIIAATTRSK